MLTIISGNNRDGYPCALNKVGDIFQCGIPPFETEGLIDLGKASQKEAFPLAGSLSLIFSSVKVTASDSAGVTVSMTSEDSAGYGKWEPCSSLAKVRKCNFINWLSYCSGIVQTTGKEKGPRQALRIYSCSLVRKRTNYTTIPTCKLLAICPIVVISTSTKRVPGLQARTLERI